MPCHARKQKSLRRTGKSIVPSMQSSSWIAVQKWGFNLRLMLLVSRCGKSEELTRSIPAPARREHLAERLDAALIQKMRWGLYVILEHNSTFCLLAVSGISSLYHTIEGIFCLHAGGCAMIAEKRKLVVRCSLSRQLLLAQLIAISSIAVDNYTSFCRAIVAGRVLVGSELCF